MSVVRLLYKIIGVGTLAVLIALPNLQVIMRGIFDVPLIGAEELARYLLIVVTFMAIPLAAAEGGHIRMEEFQARMAGRLRKGVRVVVAASGLTAFAIVTAAAGLTLVNNLENTTPTLSIPFYIFVLPVLAGSGFLAVECLIALRREIANRIS